MKIAITIQQEGMAPYEIHIDKEGHDKEFPYQTFLRRPGSAGLSTDFESPDAVANWAGMWIKEYIERTIVEGNERHTV